MSKQLLRAGTNPGAMVREAANAESGLDFIHKLAIGQKETGETQYWLELLLETNYLNKNEFDSIYKNTNEVLALLLRGLEINKLRKFDVGSFILDKAKNADNAGHWRVFLTQYKVKKTSSNA